MKRGWKIIYKDGTVLTEEQVHWEDLDHDNIVLLSIIHDGREFTLPPGQKNWIQAKTAVAEMGKDPQIQSRYVGFEHKNSQIILRVMEDDGACLLEIR